MDKELSSTGSLKPAAAVQTVSETDCFIAIKINTFHFNQIYIQLLNCLNIEKLIGINVEMNSVYYSSNEMSVQMWPIYVLLVF